MGVIKIKILHFYILSIVQLTNISNYESTVLDSIWHGQNPCPDIALQQVYNGISVRYLRSVAPILVEGYRLLVHLLGVPRDQTFSWH